MVVAHSGQMAWWRCPKDPDHKWRATVANRTHNTSPSGCPFCNCGWTLERIRAFVASLKEHLGTFTPAELYLIFQQNGLLGTAGKSRAFVKALATGRFPQREIEQFLAGKP